MNHFGYLCRCHAFCIHRDDFVIDAGYVFFLLGNNLWLKGAVSVLRHFHFGLPIFAPDGFWLCAVSVIRFFRAFILVIAEMFVHFRLEHPLYFAGEQVFKSILNIFRRFYFVFLQKPLIPPSDSLL